MKLERETQIERQQLEQEVQLFKDKAAANEARLGKENELRLAEFKLKMKQANDEQKIVRKTDLQF